MLKNYDQKYDCRSYGNAFLYFFSHQKKLEESVFLLAE